jgi:tRNA dimethylallyltransferase
MSLADIAPCTIISADSRQIYRGFDIGTAKPTADDRRRVPHRGIDVADPRERYSAAAWAAAALGWIDESLVAQRIPIVVGGTGLYLRALFEGLFVEPELDTHRRTALQQVLGSMPSGELRRWAAQLDPPRARLGRTQWLRTIEVALMTGHRLSTLHRVHAQRPRWTARYLLVDPGTLLAERIVSRVEAMFAAGWEHEVRELAATVPADAPAWKATGYRHVRALVDGRTTRTAAHERIMIDTRQYAKRQRTWFRHQLPADRVTRVDPLARDAVDATRRWFDAHTASVTARAR